MNIREKLTSLLPKLDFIRSKSDNNNSTNSEKGQSFIVIAHRDQDLYVYLTRISPKEFKVINFIEYKPPSLVVGQDEVLRANELAETISDIVEVFMHENNESLPFDKLPVILLLEPSKFVISTLNFVEKSSFSEILSQLQNQEIYEVFSQSPFIQEDTCFEPFCISENIDNLADINVMYVSKNLLRSWSDVIQACGLKIAFIGPTTTPLLFDLAETTDSPCVLLDMQRLHSKIYCLNGQREPIVELKFPYGYMQFLSNDNVFDTQLVHKRLQATLRQQDNLSHYQNAKILISGCPGFEPVSSHSSPTIEKLSYRSVKVDEKQMSLKRQVSQDLNYISRDLLLNIYSLCARIMK